LNLKMNDEEEGLSPTSPMSRPMKHPPDERVEERCGGSWSFPPPTYAREEEWCGGGWSFLPHGAREEERCGAAWGRSKPFVAISNLPLRELWVLANHRWPNVKKTAWVQHAKDNQSINLYFYFIY
jgi:hypothetical protein